MEANKENINKFKNITRIPIPVKPLPALPKHLVASKRVNSKIEVKNKRQPLKTITQINSGTQSQLCLPGSSKNLNSKQVTVQQKQDQEWSHNVFNDKKEDSALTSNNEKEGKIDDVAEKNQKSHEECTVVTPSLKSGLKPSPNKNIERSLKSPHSREIQEVSPVNKEQTKGEDHVGRRLFVTESVQERLKTPDLWTKSYLKCLCKDYTSDMFANLFNVEQKIPIPKLPATMRVSVINWLMKVNTADRNPATVQAACIYLDCVLSTGQVLVDKLQLVAATCYWIAHKLGTDGPALNAERLVKAFNLAFTTEDLIAAEGIVMERLILILDHQPVLAQEFISYLSWWCDNEHPGEIEVGATFLTACFMMVDKAYCCEYPSVIAAAAVSNALLLLKKLDLMMRLQDCPVYRAAEKKAETLSITCALIRRAARVVGSSTFEHKAPIEQYDVPPYFIAQRIISQLKLRAMNHSLNAKKTAKYY